MPESRSHKLDVLALGLLALVLFLAVALVTYHPNDLSNDSVHRSPPLSHRILGAFNAAQRGRSQNRQRLWSIRCLCGRRAVPPPGLGQYFCRFAAAG